MTRPILFGSLTAQKNHRDKKIGGGGISGRETSVGYLMEGGDGATARFLIPPPPPLYAPITFQAPTPTVNGDFGYSIDTTDTYAVIGEPGEEKAYLRTIADGTTIELVPSGGAHTVYYGRESAIDGNQVLVNAMNNVNANGTVYLFDTSGNVLNVWDDTSGDNFGFELFFTENYIGITHPVSGVSDGGIIYFYDRSAPYSLIFTCDYLVTPDAGGGTAVAVSPYADEYVAMMPRKAVPGKILKLSGGTQQFTNYIDTHDGTAGVWNSHLDASASFTNAPTSIAMSNNHMFLGVPKLNKVAVWRYADPLNGKFGSLGTTTTTPRIDGSFSVTASGSRIDLGAEAPNLISGRTDPVNMPDESYDGFIYKQGSSTWYGANGGIAWIRNKDTDEYIIAKVTRDMQVAAFPFTEPTYPTSIRTNTVNWETDGNAPASSAPIPGYTGDGTYNLQISMILQFSHNITLTGQSGETDIDFGRFLTVNPDSTELYVAAPLESWSGENRGTIYRFTLDDTVDVGFDRTLASDTIATVNGYFRGEVNNYLGYYSGGQYFDGDVNNEVYNLGSPSTISSNGNYLMIANNEFNNREGRILENQEFTEI
jgi:hypothetical protein